MPPRSQFICSARRKPGRVRDDVLGVVSDRKLAERELVDKRRVGCSRIDQPAGGTQKRHSMTPTHAAPERHTADPARSQECHTELGKTRLPLPGRQGVGGSNPPCSTSVVNSDLALQGDECQDFVRLTTKLTTCLARIGGQACRDRLHTGPATGKIQSATTPMGPFCTRSR